MLKNKKISDESLNLKKWNSFLLSIKNKRVKGPKLSRKTGATT